MSNSNNKILIYTDGSYDNENNIGGWAFTHYLIDTNRIYNRILYEYKDSGCIIGRDDINCNSMELMAVVYSLIDAIYWSEFEYFKITVYSDSAYVVDGINKTIYYWINNNWKTKKKNREINNKDLWIKLFEMNYFNNIEFKWVRGHNNNEGNGIVDNMAKNEVKTARTAALATPDF